MIDIGYAPPNACLYTWGYTSHMCIWRQP